MALLKVICWAIIFITRLRFPPGKSLATIFPSNCLTHYIIFNEKENKKVTDAVLLSRREINFKILVCTMEFTLIFSK